MSIFLKDISFDSIHFGKLENADKEKKKKQFRIPVYKNASSEEPRNQFNEVKFDPKFYLEAPYGLDEVQEGSSADRRGMVLKVEDEDTLEALRALDRLVLKTAVERSEEWFKSASPLPYAVVKDRYKPLLKEPTEKYNFYSIKVKVKCGGQVPTKMHSQERMYTKKVAEGSTDDITRGAHIVPIVSWAYGVYFAGASFGLSVQVEQMLIVPAVAKVQSVVDKFGATFYDDDDEPELPPAAKRCKASTSDDMGTGDADIVVNTMDDADA